MKVEVRHFPEVRHFDFLKIVSSGPRNVPLRGATQALCRSPILLAIGYCINFYFSNHALIPWSDVRYHKA